MIWKMWDFWGSLMSRLNASKNDHVTNLSSDQRAAAGSPRWCLPSMTGGCARGPSRGEPTSRLRLYQARVSSDTGTPDGLAIPTSMLGSCAVADRCALAASLCSLTRPVLRSPSILQVRSAHPRCATRLRRASRPAGLTERAVVGAHGTARPSEVSTGASDATAKS